MSRPQMNPYLAGVLLGLVLLAAIFVSGRGLGASGAVKSAVIATVTATARATAAGRPGVVSPTTNVRYAGSNAKPHGFSAATSPAANARPTSSSNTGAPIGPGRRLVRPGRTPTSRRSDC